MGLAIPKYLLRDQCSAWPKFESDSVPLWLQYRYGRKIKARKSGVRRANRARMKMTPPKPGPEVLNLNPPVQKSRLLDRIIGRARRLFSGARSRGR